MLRLSILLSLVACTSEDVDVGTELPQCQECGSGAIVRGRVYSSLWTTPLVANRAGMVEGVTDSALVWLRDDFTLEHSRPLSDADVPATERAEISIALDDQGGGALLRMPNGHDPGGALVGKPVTAFAPDHTELWTTYYSPLGVSSFSASSQLIVLDTISSTAAQELLALRIADGAIAWRNSHRGFGPSAFAPDGSLVIAKDPGTGLVVSALEPETGDVRWTSPSLDPQYAGGKVDAFAIGPAGEVAVAWSPNVQGAAQQLTLIDSNGSVRWSQPLEARVGSIMPEGDHVLVGGLPVGAFPSSDDTIVQYSATGVDWKRPVIGGDVRFLSIAGGRLIASITSHATTPTTIGDVTYQADGVAIVELAH